ncbi:MAG: hypothetical protein ABSC94_32995 [Polyangiaceae bacterium]
MAEWRFGLDLTATAFDPEVKLIDPRRGVAQPPLEALLAALAQALGLGVDVKDLRVELKPLDGARIADLNGVDQSAPAVRIIWSSG